MTHGARRFVHSIPLLLLLLTWASAPIAQARPLLTRAGASVTPTRAFATAQAAAPRAQLLEVDTDAIAEFRRVNGGTLEVPAPDGSTWSLVLEPSDLLAPDARLTYTDATGPHPLSVDVSLFQGTVAGDPGSWAVLALTPDGVRGTVVTGSQRYSLMPTATTTRAGIAPLHALAAEEDLHTEGSLFHCGITDENEAEMQRGTNLGRPRPRVPGLDGAVPMRAEYNGARIVQTIAVDCDQEIALNNIQSGCR